MLPIHRKHQNNKSKTLLGVLVLFFVIIFAGILLPNTNCSAALTYTADQKVYLDRWGFTPTQIGWLQQHDYPYSTIDTLYNKDYATKYPGTAAAQMIKNLEADDDAAARGTDLTGAGKGWELSRDSCGLNLKCWTAWLAEKILALFGLLLYLGAALLDVSLMLPKLLGGFTKAPIVTTGWPIVRDLANMFFALILLVIAFATILRLESYGMKAILWRLVVAALLINFSLVIAGVIIDGSNVLTNFFIQGRFEIKSTGASAGISEALMNGLKLTNIYNVNSQGIQVSSGASADLQKNLQGELGFSTIFTNLLLGIIFVLVAAFVFFSAAILFFIRLVALWILCIFAPMAWLAMILPATRTIWNKWWHEFIKWIIFAPVFAFFIYLTAAIINNNVFANILNQNISVTQNQGWLISTFVQNLSFIVNYAILVIFMVAGLFFARQAGIHGAAGLYNATVSARKSLGRGASRWAAGGAKVPGADWLSKKIGPQKWAEKGWARLAKVAQAPGVAKRFIAPMASPRVWTRTWSEMQKRADEAAFGKPAGSIMDIWESMKKLSPTDFRKAISQEGMFAQLEHQRGVARRFNEFNDTFKDEKQLTAATRKAKNPLDMEAFDRLVTTRNATNTLFQELEIPYNPSSIRQYYKARYGDTAEGARIAADLSAIGIASGNYPFAGITRWDEKLGRNRFAKDDAEHMEIFMIKMKELEPQLWARTVHPDSFIERDREGAIIGLHSFAKEFIPRMTALHIKQADRFQPRTWEMLTRKDIFAEIQKLNKNLSNKIEEIRTTRSGPLRETGREEPREYGKEP